MSNVKLIIEDVLGVKINEEDGLGTISEWDSMAQFTILLAIEKEFGIKFNIEELTDVTTLSSCISTTKKKL